VGVGGAEANEEKEKGGGLCKTLASPPGVCAGVRRSRGGGCSAGKGEKPTCENEEKGEGGQCFSSGFSGAGKCSTCLRKA